MANHEGKKPVSAFALFSKSYEIVINNIKTFAILLALPALASLFSTFDNKPQSGGFKLQQINFFNGTQPAYAIVSLIGASMVVFILLAIAALFIQAMLTSLEVEASKGKKPNLKHLWTMGKKFWIRLFLLILAISMYIIFSAIIGVLLVFIAGGQGIGAFLGIALIIAAILFVLTHYFLAPYALIDEDLSVFAAMERSANLSRPHVGAVLSVIGVIILLSLVSIIPIIGPLTSFVLTTMYIVAPALRYQELKLLHK